ncbi:uncharacterized protein [Montipora foliosa]|uniref:uncharacterized protein isoform X1 n=1 Tax=Montipora foliosa TaxID=591990 RepID=UPI0035F1FF3E
MAGKCAAVGCCFSFLVIIGFIFFLTFYLPSYWPIWIGNQPGTDNFYTLIVYDKSLDSDPSYTLKCNVFAVPGFTMPSLQSFTEATTTGFILNGLAVYSKLSNACQPLEDVRNAPNQVHKVALLNMTNNNNTLCPLEKLTVNAQNAGYSVLICFTEEGLDGFPSSYKLLIPILYATNEDCELVPKDSFPYCQYCDTNSFLVSNDRTNVEIRVPPRAQYSFELEKMKSYLSRLYYWFLVGPIITLVWLRRTKKLCWMSGARQVGEGRAVGNGTHSEIRNMEEAANRNEESFLNLVTEGTVENHHGTDDSEGQPLLIAANNAEYTRRQTQGTGRYVNIIKIISVKIAVGFCYLILIIAALPVGISSGGLSFFRFDEGNIITGTSYLHDLFPEMDRGDFDVFQKILSLFWSLFKIFYFFMYSWFACKSTWTVQTDISKLIRSDWFASNISLLVLGIVVPYCSSTESFSFSDQQNLIYFAAYDTVCTVCNGLFIVILNKHKFVTRYVFYISVCMIFAYLESNVVAVFYFALNSQGSLNNLKLTALRTVAIGLTLSTSFSSSMHIIRKLVKPEESLFKSLSEK